MAAQGAESADDHDARGRLVPGLVRIGRHGVVDNDLVLPRLPGEVDRRGPPGRPVAVEVGCHRASGGVGVAGMHDHTGQGELRMLGAHRWKRGQHGCRRLGITRAGVDSHDERSAGPECVPDDGAKPVHGAQWRPLGAPDDRTLGHRAGG